MSKKKNNISSKKSGSEKYTKNSAENEAGKPLENEVQKPVENETEKPFITEDKTSDGEKAVSALRGHGREGADGREVAVVHPGAAF